MADLSNLCDRFPVSWKRNLGRLKSLVFAQRYRREDEIQEHYAT